MNILNVEKVSKAFGEKVLLDNVTLGINKGDKIGIIGVNGTGKSTLLKIIAGIEEPDEGNIIKGRKVTVTYLAQSPDYIKDENVLSYVLRGKDSSNEPKAKEILNKLGIDVYDAPMDKLSGGQKKRVALAKVLVEPTEVLILDEPTNHLDMRTKDVLKQAIRDFNGTVILVSHDREFLDGLVSKVYEFGGGQVREHLGGIYDFLESRKLASLRELEQRATVSKTEKDGNISKDSASPAQSEDSKLSYGEQKEFARRLRKAEKAVADIESEIAGLEKRIAEVEEKLATPDGAADTSLYELHGQLKKQLDDVMWKWSEASEVLDKLQK